MRIQLRNFKTHSYLLVCIFIISSCNLFGPQFASKESMTQKCQTLIGLDRLIIDKTTIEDIYRIYPEENIIEEMGWRPNIDRRYDRSYDRISDKAEWRAFTIDNFNKNFTHSDVEVDFYRDTLVQISFRYNTDSNKLPDFFINNYGLGIPVTKKYLDSLHVGYSSMFKDDISYRGTEHYRRYQNENTHMVISEEYWDVVIVHLPKFYILKDIIEGKWLDSSNSKSSTTTRGHNSMDADDEEYWRSVNREQALKDAGLKDAARLEREARLKYLQGGGYTSPDGGSQVHYKGSKEQQEHLEEMARRGW